MAAVGTFHLGDRRIEVMPHAVDRARERVPSFRKLSWPEARVELAATLRKCGNGNLYDVKPKPWRRIGEPRNFRLPLGQRFLTDRSSAFGYVLELRPDCVTVVTVLTPVAKVSIPT